MPSYEFMMRSDKKLTTDQVEEIKNYADQQGLFIEVESPFYTIELLWIDISHAQQLDTEKWLKSFVARHDLSAQYKAVIDGEEHIEYWGRNAHILESQYLLQQILSQLDRLTSDDLSKLESRIQHRRDTAIAYDVECTHDHTPLTLADDAPPHSLSYRPFGLSPRISKGTGGYIVEDTEFVYIIKWASPDAADCRCVYNKDRYTHTNTLRHCSQDKPI